MSRFKAGDYVKGRIKQTEDIRLAKITKVLTLNAREYLELQIVDHKENKFIGGFLKGLNSPPALWFEKVEIEDNDEYDEEDYRFKVGDIVKGTSVYRYGITNYKMKAGRIVDIAHNGHLTIKIELHEEKEHEGKTIIDLSPLYFKKIKQHSSEPMKEVDAGSIKVPVSDLKINPDGAKFKKKEIDFDNLESMKKLDELIGLDSVKKEVSQIVSNVRIAEKRKNAGLKNTQHSLHMIFKGNPGTGKTTVARIAGEVMLEIGALKKADKDSMPFVELIHTDVISKWVGDAERNIKAKFEEAKGGVLFIDEAYSFASNALGSGLHDVKNDMVATIVKLMEDNRDEVLVIAAGYDEDMEMFLNANTGLRSRFTNIVKFDDYNLDEAVSIAEFFCKDMDYTMTDGFIEKMKEALDVERGLKFFGNARTVRNIIEKAVRKQSARILQIQEPTREQLMELIADDVDYDKEYSKKLIEKTKGKEKVITGFAG